MADSDAVLEHAPILVEAWRDDVHAGVRSGADGLLWLSMWTDAAAGRVAGTGLDGVEPASIRGPGWAAVGGALPGGARSVRVLGQGGAWWQAEVDRGAWVVFVPFDLDAPGPPPVRFADAAGALVSRASASLLATARRVSADQAELLRRGGSGLGGECPVCEALDWRATPAGGGSGERIFCAVCAHSDGASYGFYGSRG